MTLIKDPTAPATAPQLSYLESLVSQRDNKQVAERYRLMKTLGGVTKGQASEWIDTLLTAPKKTGKPNTIQDWGQAKQVQASAAQPVEKPQLTELPAFGYYMIDGTLHYWDCTGKDQYPILRKLQIVNIWGGGQKGSWKKTYAGYSAPKVQGTWVPFAGKGYNKTPVTKLVTVPKAFAEAVIAGAKPLSETEAGKLGKQFGFCIRCGATLTDPVSVANGIGPVCAKYW